MTPFLFFHLLFFLPLVFAFLHPGLLVTDNDIARIKTKLAAKKDPWLSSWNKLISIPYSSASYTNNAVAAIYRGSDGQHAENVPQLWHDAAAAFNLALRYQISGDTQFADASAKILVAWGNTLISIGDTDDRFLVAGLQGHEMANAAELLRNYPPFAENGLATVIKMLTDVFLPLNVLFLEHGAPSEHNVKHFFANWELCNVASAMAIGVLSDNQTIFDFAVHYFKNGTGNGAIMNAITNIVLEPQTGKPLGQGQEAGRDQGHAGLDMQMLGVIAQQAYNQEEDLFAYADNRILLAAEYYARYNLGNDVPFEPYSNGIVHYTEISPSSRGAFRPAWEVLYNHYGVIKGLPAPWTEQYRNYTLERFGHGFEGGAGSWGEGAGHYDSLGWGSLCYRLDTSDILAARNSTSVQNSQNSNAFPSNATSTALGTSGYPSSVYPPQSTSSGSRQLLQYGPPSSMDSASPVTLITSTIPQPSTTSTGDYCSDD